MKRISYSAAEAKLEKKFKGKIAKWSYPGYPDVWGMVDQISISTIGEVHVVVQMNNRRYTCSIEDLRDCLTLSTKANGNPSGRQPADEQEHAEDH